MFGMTNQAGSSLVNQERIFNFAAEFWEYYQETNATTNKTILISKKTSLPVEKCDTNKSFGEYKDLYQDLSTLSSSYCITPGKHNVTLYGVFGQIKTGFSFINIYMNKCINGTDTSISSGRTDCYSQTDINKALSVVNFAYTFVDYDIDHENVSNPVTAVSRTELLALSSTIFTRILQYRKNVIYNSDYGFVFEDKETLKLSQHDTLSYSVDLRSQGVYPGSFSSMGIFLSSKTDKYNRSYAKLQNLLANIGGIVKLVMNLAQIIVFLITRKIFYLSIINSDSQFRERTISEINKSLPNNSKFNLVDNTMNATNKNKETTVVGTSIFNKK